LKVVNRGSTDESRQALIIGVQNGVEIYAESLDVHDTPGNEGSTLFRFPSFTGAGEGDIVWMAAIVGDDSPDLDEALAVTRIMP
jgi:hypothetical protein